VVLRRSRSDAQVERLPRYRHAGWLRRALADIRDHNRGARAGRGSRSRRVLPLSNSASTPTAGNGGVRSPRSLSPTSNETSCARSRSSSSPAGKTTFGRR
jgi:hypothetical protein